MKKELIANSIESLSGVHTYIDEQYSKDRYLIVTVQTGKDRSLSQNNMFYQLYLEIGKGIYGNDEVHARRECKLTLGIPILRRDDSEFRELYNKVLLHQDYETKLEMMDYIPVTRLMKRDQGAEYISKVMDTYANKGVVWSDYVLGSVEK